jgi:hypothetical protein
MLAADRNARRVNLRVARIRERAPFLWARHEAVTLLYMAFVLRKNTLP